MKLDYMIVRSPKRKKLTITVERDCSVVVRAPSGATDEHIAQVVDSKRRWLHEKMNHPQKYQALPHAPGKETVNGESAPYLGRDYRIEIAETKSGKVEFSRKFIVPAAQQARRREVLLEWYLARANEMVVPRVKRYAGQLGVAFSAARIVDSRYRWGSCTTNDTLTFNWRLIKAPMFVIDYVIIHELAHLLESNHTARFWNIVRASSPKMEKARLWLREHGQILEQEL